MKTGMKLNTGSSVLVISISRLMRLFPRHKMFSADVQLRTATGEIFRHESFVNVHVTYKNKTKREKLSLITKDNVPLPLERDWINEFNIFFRQFAVSVQKVTTSESLRNILRDYSDLFNKNVDEIKMQKLNYF